MFNGSDIEKTSTVCMTIADRLRNLASQIQLTNKKFVPVLCLVLSEARIVAIGLRVQAKLEYSGGYAEILCAMTLSSPENLYARLKSELENLEQEQFKNSLPFLRRVRDQLHLMAADNDI